ncbi:DegT/DnrJ/EryC1/StrS family aminotransferase [Salinispora fenicalii]|uniref:DegT/DnrJ/EryC1/StrS family aminotransferase n=1 Tax=Salinispora fenicalii TaxID=1137263 RepID=UPI001CC6BE30|nr:DegT/DnrJ/EryC1/StrS family aminotransferase [Salinispora fenicalii]
MLLPVLLLPRGFENRDQAVAAEVDLGDVGFDQCLALASRRRVSCSKRILSSRTPLAAEVGGEAALQEYLGVRRVLLASSGTVALYSAYAACGIGPGDEVIVPAYTFLATATPLFHLGAIPVLADCDNTGNIDPADAESRISPRTKAIMVTHLWGIPCNMAALNRLAEKHGIMLLEDASHAHGAISRGRKVGTFGAVSAFSLNGPKPLSAGEGGLLATDDDEIYYRALLHGHYNKRCRTEIPEGHPLRTYATTGLGLKFRIHPLAAAIALEQLRHLDEYLDGRAQMADYITKQLAGVPGIEVPELYDGDRAAWYGLPLLYKPGDLDGLTAETFYAALKAEGCAEADQPGSTCPLNLHPLFQDPGPLFRAYREKLSYQPGDFPTAERIHQNTIKLPVWHRSQERRLADQYIAAIIKVSSHYRDLLG